MDISFGQSQEIRLGFGDLDPIPHFQGHRRLKLFTEFKFSVGLLLGDDNVVLTSILFSRSHYRTLNIS